MKLNRRTFLTATGALPFSLKAAERKPNIVFILLDDLGYGDLGCYGQKRIQTPHIDKLAKEGMLFTNAYAGGTVCAPSRCVMFTGKHLGHAAIRTNAGTNPILQSDVLYPEILKKAGYRTGGFGKWSMGDYGSTGAPEKHGFDQFFGYLHQTHAHDYYTDLLWDTNVRYPIPENKNGGRKVYSADVIAEKSLEFVRKHKDGPFFLYATYTLPHADYVVPSQGIYAKESWPEVEKNFAAMVTKADQMVGNLLALLKELKLEQNTFVLFASDNGAVGGGGSHQHTFFESAGKLRGHKGQMYEGGIRVPAIARYPGKIRAGSVSHTPWGFFDLFPTFLTVAGLPVPSGLDGRNILPLMEGKEKQAPDRKMYWESWGFDFATESLRQNTFAQAARWRDWKVVRTKPGAALELYDLKTDGSEKVDLAGKHPEVVATMEAFMKEAHEAPRSHKGGSRKWVI